MKMARAVAIAALVLVATISGTNGAGYTHGCEPPSQIHYGRYFPAKSSYSIGDTLTFSCNYGYKVSGASSIECMDDPESDSGRGLWSATPPVCKPNDMNCPKLMNPSNGGVQFKAQTVGSSAQYTCNKNYELVGSSYRLCQKDGSWSGAEPSCRAIECPELRAPLNGKVKGSGNMVGTTAHYSCQEGYVLTGNEYRKCQYNKEWSGESPTCQRLECPMVGSFANGAIQVNNRYYRSRIQYTCDRGYKLFGSEYRNCESNGEWSGFEPICKPINCPTLHTPKYGQVVVKGYTVDSVAQYYCSHGYSLRGDSMRTCGYNGQWSGSEPTCDAVSCSQLSPPMNGRIEGQGSTHGVKVKYVCNHGYTLSGNEYRTCGYDGIWSGNTPTCTRVTCPVLDMPQYGSVSVKEYTVGSRAVYSCNHGYQLYGDEHRVCEYNGQWSGKTPSCRGVECPVLYAPAYGSVDAGQKSTGSRARYNCQQGYSLVGDEYRTCDYNGQWTLSAPSCIPVSCPAPKAPQYGSISVNGYTFGSRVHYSCDYGYMLHGSEYQTCTYTGEWSGSAPTCKEVLCSQLSAPQYGTVNITESTAGSRANYDCLEGYELYGNTHRLCGYDGKWTGEEPTCRPVHCSDLYAPAYGSIEVNSTAYGARVRYTCDHGYQLLGSEYRTCSYSGKWSGDAPSCVAVTCGSPPVPQYGGVDVKGYTGGCKALYFCDHGYQLQGSEYRTCQYDGQWSGNTPTCTQIKCPTLTPPSFCTVSTNDTVIGSIAFYTCNHGYNLYGKPTRVCDYTGKWSGKEPSCQRVRCLALYAPTYGDVTINDTIVGSQAHYSCRHGYNLLGNQYRTCDYNGEWSEQPPVCVPVTCPPPPSPQYGAVNVHSLIFGSRAHHTCSHGYLLEGDEYRTCQYTGTWSGKTPTCTQITCPKLSPTRYGSIEVNSTAYSSMVRYYCNHGYVIYGNEYRSCGYNGMWSGREPTCKRIRCPTLYPPQYGLVDVSDILYGATASYSCKHGYLLYGGDQNTTCGYDGEWTGTPPTCRPVKCPRLRAPQYGLVKVTGYTFNSLVHYSCRHGYLLYGEVYRTCGYDGSWSGEPPVCKQIVCPSLTNIKYGKVEFNSTVYDSKAHYTCDHGYLLYGVEYRTCGYDGRWSGKPPSCKAVRCPRLYAPQYGSLNVKYTVVGSQAYYSCDHGYILKGNKNLTCEYSGEWSSAPPSCIPVTCPEPPVIQYGSLNVQGYWVGSKVYYICDHGYKLYGNSYQTCDYNGMWSGAVPTCKRITCPTLYAPQYGGVKVNTTYAGSKATYYCDHGYYLYGKAMRICDYNGMWTGKVPTCEPIECLQLYAPLYGSVSVNSTRTGSRAHYSCDHGYQLVGQAWRTCGYDGVWTDEPPQCIPVKCPELPPIQYGGIDVSSLMFGSKAVYYCNYGYKLYGEKSRLCGYDGKWIGEPPTCRYIKCPPLYNPEYGTVSVNNTIVGSKAQYSCNHGYYLYGKVWRVCDYNGEWTGKIPVCHPIQCPVLHNPVYGQVVVNGTRTGMMAHYSCEHGYYLEGEQYRTCDYSGQWTGSAPTCRPVKCPTLTAPQYGSLKVNGYTVKSVVNYYCEHGYKLYGDETRKCLYTGVWSGSDPTCKRITCPYLPSLTYGMIEKNGTVTGSSAHYTCKHGYYLVGGAWRLCDYNGVWTGKEPVCERVTCPQLYAPVYGQLSGNDTYANSRVHYSCDHCYQLSGNEYRTCGYDGEWSGETPMCKHIRCPMLTPPQYGYIDNNDKACNTQIRYFCNHGYKLYGNEYRTCQYSGVWTGEDPTCKRIECPTLPTPKYGRVDVDATVYGSKASYTCNHGYVLYGDQYRYCQYNKVWSGNPPTCKPVRCPDVYAPVYGSVTANSTIFRSRIHYSCDHGYVLQGDQYRTCDYNGQWTGEPPKCTPVMCPTLDSIQYGRVEVKDHFFGSRAHYVCNHGYILYGDEYQTCDYTGTWTGVPPTCKRITCPHLYAPKFGSISLNETTYGSQVIYSCSYGYELYGTAQRTCLYSGNWSGEAPSCKVITCPPLVTPKHGSVKGDDTTYGSVIFYSCDYGYTLYGVEYITCGHGTWSDNPPICKPVQCPPLEHPKYGSVDVRGYTYQSKAYYSCSHGYELIGSDEERTCDFSGSWSGKAPLCKPITCPLLDKPLYGIVEVKGYTGGSTALYTCKHGYRLTGGSEHRTCQYSGQWTGEAPTCTPVTCLPLTIPQYGSVDVNDTVAGSKARYSCNRGYKLFGEEYRTCGYAGTWSGSEPICQPIRCPSLSIPRYGRISTDSTSYETTVRYSCEKGYILYGNEERMCDYNGKWTGKEPLCKPIQCPRLEEPMYGAIRVTGYTYGFKAHYICNSGYMLSGNENRECQFDGTWSGVAPTCIRFSCPLLPDPDFGFVSFNTTIGSKAKYSCISGYVLQGQSWRICRDTGEWSGEAATCTRSVMCEDLTSPLHGKVTYHSNMVGAKAYYSCDKGYQLANGSATRSCGITGEWSRTAPVCTRLY